MNLDWISYSQFDEAPNEWKLEEFTFGTLNLIVGRNASGKSRTLSIISNLAKLLCGEIKPIYLSFNFDAQFTDGKKEYKYQLKISERVVRKEKLEIDGQNVLDRNDDGAGKILAEQLGRKIEFQTPVSEIAFSARRDSIQHAFFEPLYEWARSVHLYSFGTPLGRDRFFFFRNDLFKSELDFRTPEMVVAIYKEGYENFGGDFKTDIIKDLAKIGYDICDLGFDTPTNLLFTPQISGSPIGLWVQESDLKGKTEQLEISQGMFRVLSLVIHLNYSVRAIKPSCILIDDIGEGLDFERSNALIQLLMSKAIGSQIQLIMTTNDRFVMNQVPLENWTVLHREGQRCQSFNIRNAKEKFKEFQFTGLNNFDFFATDYLTPFHKK